MIVQIVYTKKIKIDYTLTISIFDLKHFTKEEAMKLIYSLLGRRQFLVAFVGSTLHWPHCGCRRSLCEAALKERII
jgi:hypothetical protein